METHARLSKSLQTTFLVFGCILTFSTFKASTEEFVEGTDYRVVETEIQEELAKTDNDTETDTETGTDETIKVVEFFNYGCPHCYKLEPFIKKWLEEKGDDVEFVRVAVPIQRAWIPLARAYYIAEKFDVVDGVHDIMFKAIFENNLQMQRTDLLEQLFAARGVEEEDFQKAFTSDEVNDKVRESGAHMRLFGLQGTPSIVVDNQYVVDAQPTDELDRTFEIVKFLVEKIRNEKDEASSSTTSVDHTTNQ
ncbi:MAG: thiol:disulfide interchange protein DsbA/DsbL [Gammaproteobacteria bacterium]|nr:thiol:disulfide interchange protein DsbA/DsbL [Gammaproteobacteria bacterium]MYF02644.1 thiol:disulfide interchange protein DsbA/DsbL [Gammaproteobacteria bacterium]MYI76769.1 thiol:disulfide interchange protein DsbA/DsbL [Gammaproteobacteria bacterium]